VTVVDLQKLSTTINKIYDHCAECERCKKGKRPTKTGHCDWIIDSGTSKHFTHDLSDFAEYHPYNGPMLNTANKSAPLQVKGGGTVFLTHSVKLFIRSRRRVISRLHPVYHVPGMEV
jgi:hypothetical protein